MKEVVLPRDRIAEAEPLTFGVGQCEAVGEGQVTRNVESECAGAHRLRSIRDIGPDITETFHESVVAGVDVIVGRHDWLDCSTKHDRAPGHDW